MPSIALNDLDHMRAKKTAPAVGSVALVPRDISDTLPGVAIAISLVPPLGIDPDGVDTEFIPRTGVALGGADYDGHHPRLEP